MASRDVSAHSDVTRLTVDRVYTSVASPLRFRYDRSRWTPRRVRNDLLASLDDDIGARQTAPEYSLSSYEVTRFDMANGDVALFAWNDTEAYWLGNTQTPSALWRTDKRGWEDVPFPVARWARRELLADLHEQAPWIEPYRYLSWFFLPVLMAKDGREVVRTFLKEHAAGFPDASHQEALSFFEEFLSTGTLEPYRETMAGKLGTSDRLDLARMSAAMGEFVVARHLFVAGYDPIPEVELGSGHALDFRVEDTLVEVARPQAPSSRRVADTPAAAIRETAGSKTRDQLDAHPGTLLVLDCSSFRDDEWAAIRDERPKLPYRPAIVMRTRPSGRAEGYETGDVPIDLSETVEFVDG